MTNTDEAAPVKKSAAWRPQFSHMKKAAEPLQEQRLLEWLRGQDLNL
jgi:hypothetical protein